MKGWDQKGEIGPNKPLPDSVQILEPPVDKIVAEPVSERREPAIPQHIAAAADETAAYQQAPESYDQGYAEQSGEF
jgi:small subunit ribosomal protein S3e